MKISTTFWTKNLMLFLILFVYFNVEADAQAIYTGKKEMPFNTYDEVPVYVMVEGMGSFYVDVVYTDNNLLYIDVYELFKTFRIACQINGDGNILKGFIEKENNEYFLDFTTGLIKTSNRTITAQDALFKEDGGYYMESKMFSDVFGIEVTFNYRSLSIVLKPSFELPIIKIQRLERMRNNISKVKGDIEPDSTVNRNYHLFRAGSFDWSLSSVQTLGKDVNNRIYAGVGTELLFGEANVSVNYYDRDKFDNRHLNYYWRWVDNEKSLLKQAQIGRIYNNTISSILLPVVGATVRNTPTTIRKASGFHTITDYTEPNWTVELYINNNLVDYTMADASGLYSFKVPIVYGYTTIKTKFYGPMGEERTEERIFIMSYSFLPAGEFEYGLSSGIVLDTLHCKFARAEVNYGLTTQLTVGGGYEYLSSIQNAPHIPFANFTFQPFRKLILSGEYAEGVRKKANVNFHLRRGSILELDYSKYNEGQRARNTNAPEELKFRVSLPYRLGSLLGYAKFDYTQLFFKEFNYNQNNIVLTANYRRFSFNNTSQLNWLKNREPYLNNETALGYKMKKGYSLRVNARYNMNEGRFVNIKSELERRYKKAYFSATYERYFIYNYNFFGISFRYDLSFARTGFSLNRYADDFIASQSFSGSMAFDSHNNKLLYNNNTSLSRGGILLYPFVDLNNNGVYDKDEPLVELERVKINGGKPEFIEKDTIIRIPDLNAFNSYFIELSDNDLENIAWRFKNKIYKVVVDPNQFKRVNIPVEVMGEVNGFVIYNNGTQNGLGRITVNIYQQGSNIPMFSTLSESNGFFAILGLLPGDYTAKLDTQQLITLGLKTDPESIEFKIKHDFFGDAINDLVFTLSNQYSDSDFNITKVDAEIEDKDSILIDEKQKDEPLPDTETEKPIEIKPVKQIEVNSIDLKTDTESVLLDIYKKEYINITEEYINKMNEYYDKLNEYLDLLLKNIDNNMNKLEDEKK